MSAAFDTVDHNILLERLKKRYKIHGQALHWFKSYLSKRSQAVCINDTVSDKVYLKHRALQGSKFGPILFNPYIAPVSGVAQRNQVSDEKYADDEQLILSFKPNFLEDQTNAIRKMD